MWDDKKIFGISNRWHLANPLLVITKNQNMRNKIEKDNWQNKWMGNMVMGKCKNKQKKSCIAQINYKHFQGGYERLQLGNVYTCHGFLQMHEFEKVHWNCMLNKIVVIVEVNNRWKYHIGTINYYYKQSAWFCVVETHATILSLETVLAYAIVLNSPLPNKWSNQNQWLSC